MFHVVKDCTVVCVSRWLRSPQALLYDPALRKTLNNLMKKLFIQVCYYLSLFYVLFSVFYCLLIAIFIQLVAEFMRLGAVIIYADFSRIIISTKKHRVSDATTYINYVTANIKNREIFHTIDMKVKRSWEYLMWLDLVSLHIHGNRIFIIQGSESLVILL